MSTTLQVWGTRGSIPCDGPGTVEFGGATSCYEVRTADSVIILDAGTGILPLGEVLVAEGLRDIDLVLSHFHFDHLQGLPFFAPLYDPRVTIRLWTPDRLLDVPGAQMLERLFARPFLPMGVADIVADLQCHTLPCATSDTAANLAPGLTLRGLPLMHPGGNAAIKVASADATVVYSGDFHPDGGATDRAFTAFLADADLALLDCTLDPEARPTQADAGHCDWQSAGRLATGCRRWLGTHHAPKATDADLRDLEAQLRAEFPNGALARAGQRIDLSGLS